MRFNTRIGGGSETVRPGRYLFNVKSVGMGQAKTGTQSFDVAGLVKEDGAVKRLVFRLWFMRRDGTKIRAGCETIQAIAKAARLPDPEQFDGDDLVGKVIGLDLDVEQDNADYAPKNTITEAFPVEQVDGKWVLPDARSGPPADDGDFDDDIPFATSGYVGTRSRRSPLASMPRVAW